MRSAATAAIGVWLFGVAALGDFSSARPEYFAAADPAPTPAPGWGTAFIEIADHLAYRPPSPQLTPAASGATSRLSRGTKSASPVDWKTIGFSHERRPIQFASLGNGSDHVLVIGPLHGGELPAADIIDRLASQLASQPSHPAAGRVSFVRDPNPDGRFRGTRLNARRVDLDRNFATANWRKVRSPDGWISGRSPGSEPETRLLVSLIESLRPARIVSLRVGGLSGWVRRSGPPDALARLLNKGTKLRVVPLDADASGSLSLFAGRDRNIPTFVINLPRRPADELWDRHASTLVSACRLDMAIVDRLVPTGSVPVATMAASAETTAGGSSQGQPSAGAATSMPPFSRRLVPVRRPSYSATSADGTTADLSSTSPSRPTPAAANTKGLWRPLVPVRVDASTATSGRTSQAGGDLVPSRANAPRSQPGSVSTNLGGAGRTLGGSRSFLLRGAGGGRTYRPSAAAANSARAAPLPGWPQPPIPLESDAGGVRGSGG